MSFKIVVMFSGYGSNFKSIIDTINAGSLNCEVVGCITNHEFCKEMVKANHIAVPLYYLPYFSKDEEKRKPYNYSTRNEYDSLLAKQINEVFKPDLVVLAGWMHVLGTSFLSKVKNVINLHPALPRQFPGGTAIKDAFESYKAANIHYSGVMAHKVVEEVDAGETLSSMKVPINEDDTLETLTVRIKSHEKGVLIQGIQIMMSRYFNSLCPSSPLVKYKKIYDGKVRTIYDIGFNLLAMVGTDRQSAFDRHICEIPEKGTILTATSAWWFRNMKNLRTSHNEPIHNHYLYSNENLMIVKKCKPLMVEVVLRGYITGSTKTSLWTHYANGIRNYCGIQFPEGLTKHQKLDTPVITPTTKAESDEPITSEQVVSLGLVDPDNWDYIQRCAMALFNNGQEVSNRNGLILADTKYEFGIDYDGNTILMDELHTCDSSRFWLMSTYEQRLSEGKDPQRFDKDCVREYVKSVCEPYKDDIPQIPQSEIEKAQSAYKKHYQMITGWNSCMIDNSQSSKYEMTKENCIWYDQNEAGGFLSKRMLSAQRKEQCVPQTLFEKIDRYFQQFHPKTVTMMAGSRTDEKWVNKLTSLINTKNIPVRIEYGSAHRETFKVMNTLQSVHDSVKNKNWRRNVYVTIAGRSNALSGVVAANTHCPVLACPPFQDKDDMMVNINSTLQCPRNVPVMTVLDPDNLAECCHRILS